MNFKHYHTINGTTDTLEYKRWQRCNKCAMIICWITIFAFVVTGIVTTSMHFYVHLYAALVAIPFTALYHCFHGALIKHERELQNKKTFITRKLEYISIGIIMVYSTFVGFFLTYLFFTALKKQQDENDEYDDSSMEDLEESDDHEDLGMRGFFVWQWQMFWIGNLLFFFCAEIFYRDPFNDQLTVFYDEHIKTNKYIPNWCLKYCLCYCCSCNCCMTHCQCCCDDVTRPTSMRSTHISAEKSIDAFKSIELATGC